MEKEKKRSPTGIFFPCTEAQKRKIKSIAAKCGLGQGEYILKRALGYEPKTVPPDAFLFSTINSVEYSIRRRLPTWIKRRFAFLTNSTLNLSTTGNNRRMKLLEK